MTKRKPKPVVSQVNPVVTAAAEQVSKPGNRKQAQQLELFPLKSVTGMADR